MSNLTSVQQAFAMLDASVQEVVNTTDRELKQLVVLLNMSLPAVKAVKHEGWERLVRMIEEAVEEYRSEEDDGRGPTCF